MKPPNETLRTLSIAQTKKKLEHLKPRRLSVLSRGRTGSSGGQQGSTLQVLSGLALPGLRAEQSADVHFEVSWRHVLEGTRRPVLYFCVPLAMCNRPTLLGQAPWVRVRESFPSSMMKEKADWSRDVLLHS